MQTTAPRKTKTMTIPSEYEQPLQTIIDRGKEMYLPAFNIQEDDQPTVLKLLYWFLTDKEQAGLHNIWITKRTGNTRGFNCLVNRCTHQLNGNHYECKKHFTLIQ